ncbi:MAG: serine--tRNA ligase [Bacteroidota bacterium]
MLDPAFIRQHPDRVREALRTKRAGDPSLVDTFLARDAERREAQTSLQEVQQRLNETSRQIGPLMKAGKRDEAAPLIAASNALKSQKKDLEEAARSADEAQQRLLLDLPNVPHESVPVGFADEDNVVVAEIGSKPDFSALGEDFEPLPHWELAERHGLLDFERGGKVAGAGFPFYLGQGARLQRGLIQFFLDLAVEHGYTEMQPPLVINEASGIGTGQIPDKEAMMYEAERDNLFLIPTAEVPVTNFHRDEIFEADALPVKYAAYTPCFRREAGSYGKDVRGLNRLHQFDKVELVQFVHPDASYDALEALRQDAERALDLLELPFRRLLMCTGDMGFTQAKKYDLEVWSAGQGRWLEVSSVSNFEAFQARRAMIRYRPEPGAKPEPLHTLNGSGLALPRIVAALLENGQQPDGTVHLPEALHRYTGFATIGHPDA